MNILAKDYVDQLNNLFFEAGWLFCEFENTPATEREHWFHLFHKGCFSEYGLNKICEILSEQVAEYDLVCDYERHNEYTTYDEIYVRRK